MEAVVGVLICILCYQQWWHSKQMGKLLDRVMANNIKEYRETAPTGPPKSRSPLNETLRKREEADKAL